jgi:hypothetical protein
LISPHLTHDQISASLPTSRLQRISVPVMADIVKPVPEKIIDYSYNSRYRVLKFQVYLKLAKTEYSAKKIRESNKCLGRRNLQLFIYDWIHNHTMTFLFQLSTKFGIP